MPFPPERSMRGPRIRKRILPKLESRSETTTRRTNSFWRAEENASLPHLPLRLSCHKGEQDGGEDRRILSVFYLECMTGSWEAFSCQFARICWGWKRADWQNREIPNRRTGGPTPRCISIMASALVLERPILEKKNAGGPRHGQPRTAGDCRGA